MVKIVVTDSAVSETEGRLHFEIGKYLCLGSLSGRSLLDEQSFAKYIKYNSAGFNTPKVQDFSIDESTTKLLPR